MKAVLNNTVLAQASKEDLVRIEGNWYFPPASLNTDVLEDSPTQYHCGWKGDAQYFHARIDEETHADIAWAYPNLLDGAVEKVGTDFAGYVAFDPSVEVTE